MRPSPRTSGRCDSRGCRGRSTAVVTHAVALTVRLFDARSLKEKRAVVRSVVERLRSRQRCAAAEVGAQDQLALARIGFATVSEEGVVAARLADRAIAQVESDLIGRGEIIAVERESWALPG